MSTQDPGFKNPNGRRMVLRKIAPGGLRETTPTPRPILELTDAEPELESDVEDAEEPVTVVEPIASPKPPPAYAAPAPPPPARPTTQSHSSVPPMVATVVTPLSTVLDPPPRGGLGLAASWKGVLGGASLGLVIVTAFVVGARLAHPSTAPAAAGGAQPATMAVVPQGESSPAVASPQPTTTAAALPVVAATALPAAAQPARKGAPRAAQPPSTPAAAPAPAKAAAVATTETAAPTAAPAASTASAQPAPDDSAQSLVPVIPASTAVVDPLVKAVQDDIKEEQAAHGK
jgi:hypothetical protein